MNRLLLKELINVFIGTGGDDKGDWSSALGHDEPLPCFHPLEILAQTILQFADAYPSHVATS